MEIRKLQRHNRGQYSEKELDRIVTKLLGRHHLSRDGHDEDSFDNVQVEKHAHGYVIYADTWADSHPGTLLDITNNAV